MSIQPGLKDVMAPKSPDHSFFPFLYLYRVMLQGYKVSFTETYNLFVL
jgi:hypothetical protein